MEFFVQMISTPPKSTYRTYTVVVSYETVCILAAVRSFPKRLHVLCAYV